MEYAATLESLGGNCVERMKNDKLYRGAVLYFLYMMADSCVALAEMMIKLKNLRSPQSYSEAIDILGEHQIVPAAFAYDFAKIAGFRNFLAHDYEKTNYEEICQIMLDKLEDVKKYIGFVESSL